MIPFPRRVLELFLLLFVLIATPYPSNGATEEEPWPGVDERVVEKIAAEHGRAPSAALINTDQGDLLLFVFLAAGAVAGFAAGYNWHKLVSPPSSPGDPLMEKRD